eukprot:gene13064-3842_t
MGCSASQNLDDIENLQVKRKNTVILKPKASIVVGEGIGQNISDNGLRIVFIFGGPGCGKGCIVHNLVNEFNFKFISAELFILRSIAERFDAEDASTADIQRLIKDNASILTLEWVLSILQEEISRSDDRPVLIDVIPNLKSLTNKGSFIRDCDAEMSVFELEFPVSFAINLSVKKDQLINKTHKSHVAVKAQKEDNKGSGLSDEVDTSRTYRRFQKYEETVHDFIEYFQKSDRLLTVDTSSGRNDVVWDSIKGYILDSEFVPRQNSSDIVILFCFAQQDVDNVDKSRHPMTDIDISELVENSQERNLLNILIELEKYLSMQNSDEKHFIINLQGIDTSAEEFSKISKKSLMFEEVSFGQLDYFIHKVRRKSKRRISSSRRVPWKHGFFIKCMDSRDPNTTEQVAVLGREFV